MLLSVMFGVERDTDFMMDGLPYKFRVGYRSYAVEDVAYLNSNGDWKYVNNDMLYLLIAAAPAGIIHLPPPLTDEQREQLKAIWTLGGRWIAKDGTGNVFAYDSKPQKIMTCCHWNNDEDSECFTVMRELSVCDLVSWSDPEPYGIGKALGVEG